MNSINKASLLITGGTGSFGQALLKESLLRHNPRRVVVFSRDELRQYEMKAEFKDDARVRLFIGDIRASMEAGVKKVVALSPDKASSPVNLYGATKLTSDKLFISSNHYSAGFDTRLSVVRYGNIMGSKGSVIPFFRKLAQNGDPLPITDERMTRFWITLPKAVDFVIQTLETMQGGELFVPRIPSMRVIDLAEAIAPGKPRVITGIRPGEKLHEEMISLEDAPRTIQDTDHFTVMPTIADWGFSQPAGETVPEGFSYTSENNNQWLSVGDLRSTLESLRI